MTTVCRRVARTDSVDLSDASPVRRSPTTGAAESDYDSARSESDLSEREGESEESPRKIDHDEDRSNPQYIPKRGTFYEHDDRTAASGEDSTVGTEGEAPAPGAVGEGGRGDETPSDRRVKPRRSGAVDKWNHDKYNEDEQTPKSREELIATYGYDIRNEDNAPHARRNRKYGRGPNKYTRQWEDEEAYRRQQAATHRRPQVVPTAKDFPQLTRDNKDKPREPKPQSPRSPRPSAGDTSAPSTPRPEVKRNGAPNRSPRQDEKKVAAVTATNNNIPDRSPPQRKAQAPAPPKPASVKMEPIIRKTESQPTQEKDRPAQAQKPPATQTPPPVSTTQAPPVQSTPQQQPAPLVETRPGSKRYSSLRQRALTDNYTPPPTPAVQQAAQTLPQPLQTPPAQSLPQQTLPQGQMAHRYVPEFQPAQPNVQQIHQPQQMMHQVHRNTQVNQQPHGPSPPHQALPQQQHPQQILQQQLVQQHQHLHNMSAPHNMPGQMPPQQGYAPQAMMQAQYMQGGNNTVYPGAPVYAAPPPAPYPHQMYQHHTYTHQPASGGVTYYSPVEQEQGGPAPRTQRRPTAAIPIVPPPVPPNAKSGSTSSDKESIDRIVDNMFVRKQRPAAHAPSAEKTDTSPSPSLTSSSISTDSRPSAERQDSKEISLESLTIESKPEPIELQTEPQIESVEPIILEAEKPEDEPPNASEEVTEEIVTKEA